MAESKLNIIIDSRTAEQRAKDLTRSLEALEQAGIRVSRTLSGQITGNNANAAAAGRAAGSVNNLSSTTNNYSSTASRAAQSSGVLGMNLTAMAATAASAATAFVGLKAALSITDEYTKMEGQIRLVTKSQEDLVMVMDRLREASIVTGTSMMSNVDVYNKIANASTSMNATQEQLIKITDLVAKAGTIGGDSGVSLNAALVQFGQALAGNFSNASQELNSINEQAKGLANALFKGAGYSSFVALKKAAEEGKFSAQDALNAILKQSDQINANYAKIGRTSAQAFEAARTQVAYLVNEIDTSFGASQAFIKAIENARESVKSLGGSVAAGEMNALTVSIGLLTTIIARSLLTSLASAANAVRTKIANAIADVQATNAQIVATRAQAASDLNAARTTLMRAEGEKARAVIAANAARAAVVAAEAEVMADRAVMASEVQRMRSTISQIEAEKVLEAQRLQAQTTDQGRQASITRMAQLQQVQAVVTREVTAAEAQLTATTLAGSQAVTAARTAQTAAIGRQATATEALNAANGRAAASQLALTAATNTGANAARGLLGVFGGPVGLVVTLAAVAGGIWMATSASDSMKLSIDKLGESIATATEKFKGLGYAQRQYLLTDAAQKNEENIDALDKAQRGFVQAVGSASLEQDSAGREKLQALLKDVEAGTINYTQAMRRIEQQGLIRTDGLFGDRALNAVRQRASALEEASVATARYAARTQALVKANADAEEAAKKRAAAEAAAKAATGGIEQKNRYEKGDAEAAKMLTEMRGQYASTKDPSVYAAKMRELDEMAKAGKPVSEAVRAEILAQAKAQDELTASMSRGKLETRQAIKDGKELARELERRRDAYVDLAKESATPEQKAGIEYAEREALIKEFASRSNGEYTRMTNWAITERDREVAATKLAHDKAFANYENLGKSEIDQIRSKYAFERSEVDLMITYTVDERRRMREALKQAEKKEIADSTNALRASFDERERIRIEFDNRRKQIEQSNLPDDQKDIAMDVARNVNNDAIAAQQKPLNDLIAQNQGQDPKLLALQASYDAELLIIRDALTIKQITQDEADALALEREKAFQTAKRDLAVDNAIDIAGSLSSIMKSVAGEQSKAYKVMFAVEKGFAIAKSIMAIQTAMASAAMSLPFPANLGAIATVAAQTANIVSNIMSVKMAGQAHDGIDYVPKEGTWLLDKGERVLSPKQNSDLTNYMQRDTKAVKSDTMVAGGGLNVTIQNYGTSKQFDVQQISESEVRIIARDEVAKGAGKAAAADLSNPNSEMSKGINRNYQTERRR